MPDAPVVIVEAFESGVFIPPPKAQASAVYVVLYKDGQTRAFTGPPSIGDRWGSRVTYMVDMSVHAVTRTYTARSADDAYSFSVELSATWQATDAVAVTRGGITDGNAVVGPLQDEIWRVARQFGPQDSAGAEQATRSALARLAGTVSSGITLLTAAARFQADSRITEAQRTLDRDTLAGRLEEERLTRLRKRFDGTEEGAIREHLLQHPEDTLNVVKMLAAGREREQELKLTLLKEALDRGFITDADAQPFRDYLLGAGQPGRAGPQGPGPLSGPRPALGLPSGVTVPGSPSGTAGGLTGAGGVAGTGGVTGTSAVTGTGGTTWPTTAQSAAAQPPGVPPVVSYVIEDADPGSARRPAGMTAPALAGTTDPAGAGDPDPAAAGDLAANRPDDTPGGVRGWKPLGRKPGQR